MDAIKLLLVEDVDEFREVTKDTLELTGRYEVFAAKNGLEGYKGYKSFAPDIIATDIDMPVMSGLEMIEKIRKEDNYIPIIVSSGVATSINIGKSYSLETDNIIKKPFLPTELDGCITALFRRIAKTEMRKKNESKIFILGSYTFDFNDFCLIRNNIKKSLTSRESMILQMICENKGEMVKRKDLLEIFWEHDDFYTSRSLDVFISNIRKALKDDNTVEIRTIRGEGFKLIC
jgi:Response regulators consisting of a CheY-like receiver domain and a winged-helix DNA-binding domain